MKKILTTIFIIISVSIFSQTTHKIYFEGTDYELNVYKIKGRNSGNTLMIIGGIHNEPGGYLAADHYVDLTLEKGNLIVVPRANFLSIIEDKRGIHGDMNRKFADHGTTYEYKIVEIIKELIQEADILLNLHDGSGFYREKYISSMKNPMRYGQSLIADTDTLKNNNTGEVFYLDKIANKILDAVNSKIENEEYHFHFNNHNTFASKTLHPEQRKSATFYAAGNCGIPAFGIETSKSLPSLKTKIRFQILMINEFMKMYDIVPEIPGLYVEPPRIKFIVLTINDENPMVVPDKTHIHIDKGDEIEITHIESNYERGITVDVLKHNSLNDFRKKIKIFDNTRIIVRKDNFIAGNIEVRIRKSDNVLADNENISDKPGYSSFNYILLDVNNQKTFYVIGEKINLTKGDIIKIIDTVPSIKSHKNLRLNFYGYVPNSETANIANDIGYEIDTDSDLIPRFSVNNKGENYKIRVEDNNTGAVLETFFVHIKEPVLKYIVVKSDGKKYMVENNEEILLPPDFYIEIDDIVTNIANQKGINISLLIYDENNQLTDNIDLSKIAEKTFKPDNNVYKYEVQISKGRKLFGKIYIKIDTDFAKK